MSWAVTPGRGAVGWLPNAITVGQPADRRCRGGYRLTGTRWGYLASGAPRSSRWCWTAWTASGAGPTDTAPRAPGWMRWATGSGSTASGLRSPGRWTAQFWSLILATLPFVHHEHFLDHGWSRGSRPGGHLPQPSASAGSRAPCRCRAACGATALVAADPGHAHRRALAAGGRAAATTGPWVTFGARRCGVVAGLHRAHPHQMEPPRHR